MDRQTDSYGEASITPKTSLAGVYKLIVNVEKSLKNDPTGSQNFMGGGSLFHDLWFKI